MSDFEYFWGYSVKENLGKVTDFIYRIIRHVMDFFDTLPSVVQMAFYFILALVVFGILSTQVLGIFKNRKEWKKHPKNDLMFSYFCGSGSLQRKLSYKEAHRLLHDRRWSWVSFAGLAFRLGNFTHESRVLTFACSLFYLPMVILGFVEMVLRVIIGTAWLLVTSLVHRLVLLVFRWITYILIPIWQTADKAMRINQHCPHCYETFNLPAFVCPECGKIHKQLIPSRCGILLTSCECGRFFSSTLFTGRSNLQAACPACERELVAANAKPFSIQLVGGNSSGKTAYLAAFQHLYIDKTVGIKNLYISGEPNNYFDDLEKMYQAGLTEPSSETTAMPYSFVHKLYGNAKHNLVIYDIPDEAVLSGSYERNPRNLGFSDGIVFIVDPLSIAAVREECLKSGDSNEVDNYSIDDIGELIIAFVQLFSSITGRTARKLNDIPVAIIINKADIKAVKCKVGLPKIRATFGTNPEVYGNDIAITRDELCRAYLSGLGLDNALNNLDGTFSNIRYFPVSSIGHVSESGKKFAPTGVLAPIAWIAAEANSGISPILKNAEDFMSAIDSQSYTQPETKESLQNERYKEAEFLFANGQYDAALKIYLALKGYRDSIKRISEIKTLWYKQAEKLLSSKEYEDAIETFKALGSYKDASSRVLDVQYQLAEYMITLEDYIGAIAIFDGLGNYKDAPLKKNEYIAGLIKQGVKNNLPFGAYSWCVLAVTDSKALLVTEQIIEKATYNDNRTSVTWENCSLRSYLNGNFYNNFNTKEKGLIVTSNIINPANAEHKTAGGNATTDNVFLLSIDEVKQYFTNDADRIAQYNRVADWWWLRSPGGDGQYAAGVEGRGNIVHGGNGVTSIHGLRPALFIKL